MVIKKDEVLDFNLLDEQGKRRTLSEHLGKRVIFYFCYKNDSNKCEHIMNEYKKQYNSLMKKNIIIYCITGETVENNYKFKLKNNIPFSILSDKELNEFKRFDSLEKRTVLKKTVYWPMYSVFLINEEGYLINSYLKPSTTEEIDKSIRFIKLLK